MARVGTPRSWASEFGLARSPLFEAHEVDDVGDHSVLLDGGYGSFALSVSRDGQWASQEERAGWSWSSNLPHHVTVTERKVRVVRWDKPGEQEFVRTKVEDNLEAFYAYLTADRVGSNFRVVEHMLHVFRSLRSLLAESDVPDSHSVDVYLALLSRAMTRDQDGGPVQGTEPEGDQVLRSLPASAADGLLEVLNAPRFVEFAPDAILAVRHAGSDIFQEAHFELVRSHGTDLFGYAKPAELSRVTRGGAHFTPPALARSVVEQALACIPDLAQRQSLTILDAACGSGAFLHEALRTLRRTGFRGHVRLVGRDRSRPAVSMARFVLRHALSDWRPAGGCEIDLQQADSLASTLPCSDVVVMNPPFVSGQALEPEQRSQMASVLGPLCKGRLDYSVAFVTRALEALAPDGVMATLVPSSVLVSDAASRWREDLLNRTSIHFIGSLGDYGLFPYAQVQVAMVVLSSSEAGEVAGDLGVLVTDNDRNATGDGLRELRKAGRDHGLRVGQGWRLFRKSRSALGARPTWRLVPQQMEAALKRLFDSRRAVPASDLFRIREGVKTGRNSVFLLARAQLETLPDGERRWFKPAITRETLQMGQMNPERFVFYPYDESGLAITTEEQLVEELPEYFDRFLGPDREPLARRPGIRGRTDWWGLSRHRKWARKSRPRIVSKFFGASGAFAADAKARFVVVQGHAWLPVWRETKNIREATRDREQLRLLSAYAAILNSNPFQRLLAIYSPRVAGGQYDLSVRYVRHVPVPNVASLWADERTRSSVDELAVLGAGDRRVDSQWLATADSLVEHLYGRELLEHLQ